MNREILFRAKIKEIPSCVKSKQIGDWIYGSHLSYPIAQIIDLEDEYIVDPDTVGQFTGLYDANNKKVFEGDIFHIQGRTKYFSRYENGAFRAVSLNRVQEINWVHYPLDCYFGDDKLINEKYVVIGNIYDNPELIKEV